MNFIHPLVHKREKADGRRRDAHGVYEATGEEAAEDGAEVIFGNLCFFIN